MDKTQTDSAAAKKPLIKDALHTHTHTHTHLVALYLLNVPNNFNQIHTKYYHAGERDLVDTNDLGLQSHFEISLIIAPT